GKEGAGQGGRLRGREVAEISDHDAGGLESRLAGRIAGLGCVADLGRKGASLDNADHRRRMHVPRHDLTWQELHAHHLHPMHRLVLSEVEGRDWLADRDCGGRGGGEQGEDHRRRTLWLCLPMEPKVAAAANAFFNLRPAFHDKAAPWIARPPLAAFWICPAWPTWNTARC